MQTVFNLNHFIPKDNLPKGASKCVSCVDTLGRRRPSVSGRPSVSVGVQVCRGASKCVVTADTLGRPPTHVCQL
ncbi:hypothetical protein ACOMHN_042337 [Nucella lapillus]